MKFFWKKYIYIYFEFLHVIVSRNSRNDEATSIFLILFSSKQRGHCAYGWHEREQRHGPERISALLYCVGDCFSVQHKRIMERDVMFCRGCLVAM